MNRTAFPNASKIFAAALLLAGGLSCNTTAPIPASQPAGPPVSIAPSQSAVHEANLSATNTKSLTALRWVAIGLQRQYLINEGEAHRGKQFNQLVLALLSLQKEEPPLSEREMLELLGKPDYIKFAPNGAGYAYLFADPEPKDHVALITVTADGTVDVIGFNLASAVDLRTARIYPFWPDGKFPMEAARKANARVGAYLGIDPVQAIEAGERIGYGLAQIAPDSPASGAGLRVGDIIIAIDGTSVAHDSDDDFRQRLSQFAPGQVISLTVRRESSSSGVETQVVKVTLGWRYQP